MRKIIVEKGKHSDCFTINPSRLVIKNPIPIYINKSDNALEVEKNSIGVCVCKYEGYCIVAEIEEETYKKLIGLYPAIGFNMIKYDVKDKDVFDCRLRAIIFSKNPNEDETIKPVE